MKISFFGRKICPILITPKWESSIEIGWEIIMRFLQKLNHDIPPLPCTSFGDWSRKMRFHPIPKSTAGKPKGERKWRKCGNEHHPKDRDKIMLNNPPPPPNLFLRHFYQLCLTVLSLLCLDKVELLHIEI